jgi:hypothetical protein
LTSINRYMIQTAVMYIVDYFCVNTL